jgi:multidrug efflux pump
VGRLFREFAVTLSVTILVSAVVSLTLTPMMSAKLLKHTPASEQNAFYRKSEEFFDYVIAKYAVGVRLTLLVTLATFILTVFLYIIVPKGFFPVQDTGVLLGITEAPQTISFSAMAIRQEQLAKVILQDKDVESLSSFIGIDATNSTLNSGRIQINLRDRESRSDSATDVIQRLQPRLA